MAVRKYKQKALAIALKRDSDTTGADYIAAGATALGILTKNAEIDISDETVSRELDGIELGSDPELIVGTEFKLTFQVEIQGSGVANSPTAYAALLQAAGRDVDTTTKNTEVSYSQIDDGTEKDITCYFELAGHLYSGVGCRGNVKSMIKVKELPVFEFELTGVFGDLVDGNVPNKVYSAFKKPLKVGKQNTTFTIDGKKLELYEYEWDHGISIEVNENTEYEGADITDVSPSGKIVVSAPALSAFDPNAIAESEILVPYTITHGTQPGLIYSESNTGVQLKRPKATEVAGGLAAWEIELIGVNTTKITTK